MIHAEHRYTLPVAPATAFAYLSNPGNDAEWQSSCSESELLGPSPEVGCEYRIVFNFMSRKMNFLSKITERNPDTNFAFASVEGSFRYEGRYTFTPIEGGVEVHWQFSADPGKFFGILPSSLIRKVLVSQIQKDVITLRKYFAKVQAA